MWLNDVVSKYTLIYCNNIFLSSQLSENIPEQKNFQLNIFRSLNSTGIYTVRLNTANTMRSCTFRTRPHFQELPTTFPPQLYAKAGREYILFFALQFGSDITDDVIQTELRRPSGQFIELFRIRIAAAHILKALFVGFIV